MLVLGTRAHGGKREWLFSIQREPTIKWMLALARRLPFGPKSPFLTASSISRLSAFKSGGPSPFHFALLTQNWKESNSPSLGECIVSCVSFLLLSCTCACHTKLQLVHVRVCLSACLSFLLACELQEGGDCYVVSIASPSALPLSSVQAGCVRAFETDDF